MLSNSEKEQKFVEISSGSCLTLKTTTCLQIAPKSLSDILSSPATDLAVNLQVLSTGPPSLRKETREASRESTFARRKLSLNIGESPCAIGPTKQLSVDDGCCMESPSPSQEAEESPFFQNRFKPSSVENFRRVCSDPGYDPSTSRSINYQPSSTSTPNIGSLINQAIVDPSKENKWSSGSISHDDLRSGFKSPNNPAKKRVVFADETNVYPLSIPTDHLTSRFKKTVSGLSGLTSVRSKSTNLFCRQQSMDDGFVEQIREETENAKNVDVPKGFDRLLFSPVIEINEAEMHATGLRAASDQTTSIKSTSTSQELFCSPNVPTQMRKTANLLQRRYLYARSESMREQGTTPVQIKRRKSVADEKESSLDTMKVKPRQLIKCHSETEISIKCALNWDESQQDLIGDFSRKFCLPLINGKHQDLKAISTDTMAKLLSNDFSKVVENFTIIDCRYPYEYEGGHIKGAKNIYTMDDIIKEFFDCDNHRLFGSTSEKRTVFIFHCEFSSERGPKLSRFLRNQDRDTNSDMYPNLHYPELYLLEGGYKAFYESYPELCEPHGYTPMLHSSHMAELKHFRSKSSSWIGDRYRATNSCGSKILRPCFP